MYQKPRLPSHLYLLFVCHFLPSETDRNELSPTEQQANCPLPWMFGRGKIEKGIAKKPDEMAEKADCPNRLNGQADCAWLGGSATRAAQRRRLSSSIMPAQASRPGTSSSVD